MNQEQRESQNIFRKYWVIQYIVEASSLKVGSKEKHRMKSIYGDISSRSVFYSVHNGTPSKVLRTRTAQELYFK